MGGGARAAGDAVAQSRLVPVCLWLDHNAGSLGVEVG